MEQTIQLQFLDLDDIDHSEIEYVKSLLYSVRSPRLKLPWVESEEVSQQWTQQQQYDGERDLGEEVSLEAGIGGGVGVGTAGGGPGAEVYQVQVPVPPCTTMQQITYHHQVVPPLPPPYGIPQPYTIPQYPLYPGEERGRRGGVRSKPSPKRGGADRRQPDPPPPAYPPPVQYSQYPIHVTMPPAPYQYLPQAQHIPSAQHAAGPPLYLAPPPNTIPVYPTHIYGSYTPVFSPHMQQPQQPPQQPPQQHQVAPPVTEYKEPENEPVALPPPVEKEEEDVPEEVEEEDEEEEPCEIKNEEPAPTPQPPAVEKPLSMPINAIKTTSPPVLPVVKKRPPEEGSPAPAPVPPPPAPAPVAPGGSKSWAGLFKEESSLGGGPRKPPISAVVLTPPRYDPGLKPAAPLPPTTATSDEDPALRKLGEMLSTYQLEHKAIVVTPRGLNNPSNYCYINATLQALLACPAFYNLIRVIAQIKQEAVPSPGPPPGAAPSTPKSKTPVIDSMVQFIKEFSPAPVNRSGRREKALWKDKEELDIQFGSPFEPTYVYKMLHVMRNETAFQVEGRQEDAEEFLSLLLNGLNDEMLELMKMVEEPKESSMVNGDVTSNGENHQDDSDWKEVSKGVKAGRVTRRAELAKTPLSEIFRGQLRSRLQRNDEESTHSVQPFFTLQLDIESSDSVEKALEKFVGMYPVEGASSGETWQQQQVEELPAVLILHLKCFHYQQQTCLKISKSLEFPIHLRFESKHVSNKNKAGLKLRQYKLFAVVYHDGKEASKGHYLADVFHVGFGGWLRFDDALVRPVTEATLLRPRPPRVPYLLYYRRADTIGTMGPVPR